MDLDALEQRLHNEWAVERTDIYGGGVLPLDVLAACQPMRPNTVLERLGINSNQLIGMLLLGHIGRPGKRTNGRVAWRADEIAALVPYRD